MFLSLDTVYHGQRNPRGGATIVHVKRGALMERLLIPGPSMTLHPISKHFEWGYIGAAPAQLALALLLDFTRSAKLAIEHYEEFLTAYVSHWHEPRWQISGAEMAAWLQSNGVNLTSAQTGRPKE